MDNKSTSVGLQKQFIRNPKALNKAKNVIYARENSNSPNNTFLNSGGNIPNATAYNNRSMSNDRHGTGSSGLMSGDGGVLGTNALVSGSRNAPGMAYRSTGRSG